MRANLKPISLHAEPKTDSEWSIKTLNDRAHAQEREVAFIYLYSMLITKQQNETVQLYVEPEVRKTLHALNRGISPVLGDATLESKSQHVCLSTHGGNQPY